MRSRRRRARRWRRKRRRGLRTKGRGRDIRGRRREGGWKRTEKDEEDEEGDHGSIVAFRIPCRPSVDFRPLPLRSPLQLLQPTCCTPCSSPPPFVPSTIVPVIPQSPLPSSYPCAIPRLARGPQPSTAVAYLHRRRARVVTQAQTHRPDIRLSSLLSSPFPPSSSLFSSPSFVSASRLTLYFSRTAFSPSLSPSLFLSRSRSFSLPLAAFPAAASRRRRAKLARHRVGQWRE